MFVIQLKIAANQNQILTKSSNNLKKNEIQFKKNVFQFKMNEIHSFILNHVIMKNWAIKMVYNIMNKLLLG